jgi:hypothetical protein
MHIVLWWEFVHCLIIGSFFMGERKMKRRKKMNTKKFKVFVEALESLPEHIRNNKVDMHSVEQPLCGTVGCFAGLISIVAEDIPELKELYALHTYSFSDWANALQDFLGIGLEMWAWENPKLWENTSGINVYSFNEAWGKSEDETLKHNDIIIHLRKALDNLINQEKINK